MPPSGRTTCAIGCPGPADLTSLLGRLAAVGAGTASRRTGSRSLGRGQSTQDILDQIGRPARDTITGLVAAG